MAQQIINTGGSPADGNGDNGYTSFTKVNANFTDLYNLNSVYTGAFSGKPSASSSGAGATMIATDLIGGAGYTRLYSDGTYWRTFNPIRINGTGAAGAAFTGSTGNNTAASLVIPAGLLTPTGSLQIFIRCGTTNGGGGNKSAIVTLGGTQLGSSGNVVASNGFGAMFWIQNRNVQNAQIGGAAAAAALFTPWGDIGAQSFSTASIDTTQNQTLAIVTQLTNAADSITLNSWEIWLVN